MGVDTEVEGVDWVLAEKVEVEGVEAGKVLEEVEGVAARIPPRCDVADPRAGAGAGGFGGNCAGPCCPLAAAVGVGSALLPFLPCICPAPPPLAPTAPPLPLPLLLDPAPVSTAMILTSRHTGISISDIPVRLTR